MGLRLLAPLLAAVAVGSPSQLSTPSASPLLRLAPRLAASRPPLPSGSKFLQAHQQAGGGFAEDDGTASPALTAWAALALVAARRPSGEALGYLRAHEDDSLPRATLALVALAEAALGEGRLAAALPTGPGQTNAVIWTILARRQAGLPVPTTLVQTLLDRESRSGGWGWGKGVAPDSNDTAAAIQALRSAGVSGEPVRRGLGYLRRLRNRDGGFALVSGRQSDAQSTAWAAQAFLAARQRVPGGAYAYLGGLRRGDGSYRYSARYAATPVWVTAQVLPAVMKLPFPLRPAEKL